MVGPALYAEPLQNATAALAGRWLTPERAKHAAALAGELPLFTLVAQITSLPFMVYYFKNVSLISLVGAAPHRGG
jgi:hypothetical protein